MDARQDEIVARISDKSDVITEHVITEHASAPLLISYWATGYM